MRIQRLLMMKIARLKGKVADPRGRKLKFIIEQHAVVVGGRSCSRSRQRSRLQQVIVGFVQIKCSTYKPVRLVRLREIQAARKKGVAKWSLYRCRYSNSGDAWNLASRSKPT